MWHCEMFLPASIPLTVVNNLEIWLSSPQICFSCDVQAKYDLNDQQ